MTWYWWVLIIPVIYFIVGVGFAWLNSIIDPRESVWSHGVVIWLWPFYFLHLVFFVVVAITTLIADKLREQ